MIKNLFTYTCIIFLLFSFENCNSQAINNNVKKEEWAKNNFSTWPQILLTNRYQFEGRPSGQGGSAFLIEYGNDTFACTAKHLLGDAMSIEPEVPLDSVNTLLIKWKLFARKNVLSNDTIIIKSLVKQEKTDKEDILLFDIEPLKTNIMPLKLYLGELKVGQKLKVIGCEYGDDCYQKVFDAYFYTTEKGLIYLISDTKFRANGFSGAPVIDENGHVIGLLIGGGVSADKLVLGVQSIKPIQKWVKN